MGLAKNIKALRKERRWSQTELAEKVSVHVTHISRIETGKYKPSVNVLQKIADAFDVEIGYLLSNYENMPGGNNGETSKISERLRLIQSLDEDDREALLHVIDLVLAKKKVMDILSSKSSQEYEISKTV